MPMGSHPHLHSPCDRCGYPRRFKQFHACCSCTTPESCPHPPVYRAGDLCRRCGGRPSDYRGRRLVSLPSPPPVNTPPIPRRTGPVPPLQVAPRYADGPPRSKKVTKPAQREAGNEAVQ